MGLEAYRHRVRGHARAYLDSLGDGELVTPREMNVDGETLLHRPADIFVHVLLHERQHHGDGNTLPYQLGIETPIVEYRFLPAWRPGLERFISRKDVAFGGKRHSCPNVGRSSQSQRI